MTTSFIDIVAPVTFVHAGHTVVMKSKSSETRGALFSADITRPDGTELHWGLWYAFQMNAERNVIHFIDQQGTGGGK